MVRDCLGVVVLMLQRYNTDLYTIILERGDLYDTILERGDLYDTILERSDLYTIILERGDLYAKNVVYFLISEGCRTHLGHIALPLP